MPQLADRRDPASPGRHLTDGAELPSTPGRTELMPADGIPGRSTTGTLPTHGLSGGHVAGQHGWFGLGSKSWTYRRPGRCPGIQRVSPDPLGDKAAVPRLPVRPRGRLVRWAWMTCPGVDLSRMAMTARW